MRRSHRFDPWFLAGMVLVTRLPFRSHVLYDLDSVNFALGTLRFDPTVQQPHPPGYFLYVLLGRLVNVFVHDPNLAFVLISLAASCGAMVLIYQLALEWFGADTARMAGFIFLVSPLAWFHGVVALTYGVEAFFSALLGYLCWRIDRGQYRIIPAAAIVLGIAAGVRPSSFLFLVPLFLYSVRRAGIRPICTGMAVLGATVAAWFFPMIAASGGFARYFGALFFLWGMVPSKHTVFNSSPVTSIARAATIALILVLIFGAMALAPLAAFGRTRALPADPAREAKKRFTLVWIVPALLFFTLVFLKFVNSGYLLLLAPAGCLWLGFLIVESFRSAGFTTPVRVGILACAAAINTWVFLASPFYCSWRSIRHFESDLTSIQKALALVSPERDTLIIAFDSHFLGFRHAGYYLPDSLTIEYPEVTMKKGVRVFAMHGRDTRLIPEIPLASYRRFAFFPLPKGPDYQLYMQEVLSKLPARDLRTVQVDGRDFITGPASDLKYLFPKTTADSASGVYAGIHPASECCKQEATP